MLDCISSRSGLAVALSGHLGQLVCLSTAVGPEINGLLVIVVDRGVTALLGGHVDGTDHDRLSSSAEPGLRGGMGVAAHVLGTLVNALQAVSAATLVITSISETLSEFDLLVDMLVTN